MGEPLTPLRLVSERLRELRRRKGVTQDEAAAAIGIRPSYLSRLETGTHHGEASMKVAGQMASYYGTSIDYLVGRTEKEAVDPDLVGTESLFMDAQVLSVPKL